MIRLGSGKICPRCNTKTRRLHRSPWMRIVPGTRYYRCPCCQGRFLFFLGLLIFL